jgi:hypothetical protein
MSQQPPPCDDAPSVVHSRCMPSQRRAPTALSGKGRPCRGGRPASAPGVGVVFGRAARIIVDLLANHLGVVEADVALPFCVAGKGGRWRRRPG